MDNNNPHPDEPPRSEIQEPVDQPNSNQNAGRAGGMKVLQPLDSDLKLETAPQPAAAPTQPTAQAVPPETMAASPNQPPKPNSIYPEVTKGIGATNNYAVNQVENTQKPKDDDTIVTFSDGYSIGGTIFWYQFIAVILFALILHGIDSSLLKNVTLSMIAIVSAFYYLFEYFVFVYIPYYLLNNNASEEPFWLTIFGAAVQSLIFTIFSAILYLLLFSFIFSSYAKHGVSLSVAQSGESVFEGIVIDIIILVCAYFLTKLSWGIGFSIFGKIKNKVIVKAIGTIIIACVVGSIAYHYISAIISIDKFDHRLSTEINQQIR